MINNIARWRGKLLTEYTKEELIEIINKLNSKLEQERKELERRTDYLLGVDCRKYNES